MTNHLATITRFSYRMARNNTLHASKSYRQGNKLLLILIIIYYDFIVWTMRLPDVLLI